MAAYSDNADPLIATTAAIAPRSLSCQADALRVLGLHGLMDCAAFLFGILHDHAGIGRC